MAKLIININDDGPVAVDDSVEMAAHQETILIDAFDNDDFGADGPSGVVTHSDSSHGVVTYDAATHMFTYAPTGGWDGYDSDSFTYTITDGDGDTATATVTVTVAEDINNPPTITVDAGNDGADDVVYEAGLPDGTGVAPTTITVDGHFTVADPDGVGEIISVNIGVGNSDWDIDIGKLKGSVIDGANGTLTVTDYDATTGVATYSYTLTSPTTDVADVTETDVFTLTTSDGESTSAPALITIKIVDDKPIAHDVSDSTAISGEGTNLMIILDVSGSMNTDPDGKHGFESRLDLAKDAISDLITGYKGAGDVQVQLVTFHGDAHSSGWMSADSAIDVIDDIANDAGSGATNYDAALATAMAAFETDGKIADDGTPAELMTRDSAFAELFAVGG
jgi:hypothetical protein